MNSNELEEDVFIKLLLHGNTVSCGDLQITDLSKSFGKNKIQVYKRKYRHLKPNKDFQTEEYNKIFSNHREAIHDYLRIKEAYFDRVK